MSGLYNQLQKIQRSMLEQSVQDNLTSVAQITSKTGWVDPKQYGAKADGTTDDSQAIINAFNYAVANKKDMKFTSGVHYIASPLVFDIGNAYSFNLIMEGSLKPASGIGTALTVKNATGSKIYTKFEGGGNSTDIGLMVQNMAMSTFGIIGVNFLGTLFNVTGTSQDNNKCVGCTVDYVLSSGSGRAILHGGSDNAKYTDAFGVYKTIWDRGSSLPIRFQNAHDLSITHLENYFQVTTQNSVEFYNCSAIHIDTLAIGGRALSLIDVNNSTFFSINKLYMTAEDVAKGSPTITTNGMNLSNNATALINNVYNYNLNNCFMYTTGCDLVIKWLNINSNNNVAFTKDGTSIGYPLNKQGTFMVQTEYVYKGMEFVNQPQLDQGLKMVNVTDQTRYTSIKHQTDNTVNFQTVDSTGTPYSFLSFRSNQSQSERIKHLGYSLALTNYTNASSSLSPSASPYYYQNTNSYPVQLVITGGTVTSISIAKQADGGYTNIGITQGVVYLAPTDNLQLVYTAVPSVKLFQL